MRAPLGFWWLFFRSIHLKISRAFAQQHLQQQKLKEKDTMFERTPLRTSNTQEPQGKAEIKYPVLFQALLKIPLSQYQSQKETIILD